MYLDNELEWVLTSEVKVGDKLACLLSDAEAYPVVTGWTDIVLNLSRYEGLKDVTHRTFSVPPTKWWVDHAMLTHDLASQTLIMKRNK